MDDGPYAAHGWLLCDFDGDDGECDNCESPCNPTYYRRTSFEYDEGEYSCAKCIEQEIRDWEIWEEEYEESMKEAFDG